MRGWSNCGRFSTPGRVVIVADEQGFHGLITRVDLLNYFKRQSKAA